MAHKDATQTAQADSDQLSYGEIFHTIGGSIREYRKESLITPALMVGEVVIECVLPFITSQLIDAVNLGADLSVVGHYSLILVLLALISLAFGAAGGVTASVASAGLAKNLRHDMFASIQNFSFSNIDHFSTSSLVTRLTTDTTNVQMAYMMIIRTLVRSPMMMVFAIIMAYITGGPLATVYVVAGIILAVGIFGIAIKTMPMFRRIFKRYDALNDSVKENVDGIRVVKSYVREDYEKKKFERASGAVYHDFVHVEKILAFNSPIMTLCIDVIYVFVVFFGSRTIITTQGTALQIGQMSALITYGFSMLMSLMMLSMVFVMITMAEESARRICQVLLEKSDITNPANPIMEVPNGQVDFDHVSFRYEGSDTDSLSDIDLHIRSGETIGIIGGTGSAKTTLIQLISRLYDATSGTVEVGGHDVRDYDLATLRDKVAVVLQRNQLFSGTIADNLRWGNPDATDEEIVAAAKLAQADEFVQQFPDGYNTYITQGGTNVSGGQKQRLCIARALLKNPKVLILDDSTSAVDTKTDRKIREGFKNYIPSVTKIIIAQRTSSVEDADRIVVMDQGRIDAVGTSEELLRSNEIYRDIYLTQNKESHDTKMEQIKTDGSAPESEVSENA